MPAFLFIKKAGDIMADGTVTIDTSLDNKGFKSGVESLTGSAKGLAGTLTGIIGGISFATLVKSITDVGSSLEAAMSKVQAISGSSAEDMILLTNAAKEMGAKTKFSASESAEALQYMAMA